MNANFIGRIDGEICVILIVVVVGQRSLCIKIYDVGNSFYVPRRKYTIYCKKKC